MRRLGQLAVVLAVLGVIVWLSFDQILLRLPGILDGIRHPIGPHREIDWDQGPATASQPAAPRAPNIVVIVADDLGWNDTTFNGGGVAGSRMPTPNIDSIARDGVRFTAAYSGSGTCAPSRAALMSGRYPTRFGFEFTPTPKGMGYLVSKFYARSGILRQPITFPERGEELPFERMGMPPSEITLAELLRSAGYHTVHIGKWHLGDVEGMAPHEQGFDESLTLASGKYLPDDDPQVVNSYQDFDPIDRFLWPTMKYAASFNGSARFAPRGYLTNYYTEEATKVIAANRNRPFFLYLAHWAPHTPLQAWKPDYDALSDITDHRLRVYAAMIRALDRGIGQVLEALRVNGLEDNTLVFFTSDNGGAGYLGLDGVNDPFRGWKITFFEGGIHVPFFIKWPARIPAGEVYDRPVHHFDIYATAAAAAGVPLPQDRPMDGVDLSPYVAGKAGVPHRALFWRSGHYQVVLADGWKLQVTERPGKKWLFHLEEDPTERVNLADQHPDKVAELEAQLALHNSSQLAPAWPSLAELPVSIDKTLAEPESPDDEYIDWPN
jgi:arylsulfatase A-like enzyme